ncbi:MAG: hypothetical protein QHJ73_12255 [Armatimonadota bacterium]|nr:hypothetical protein [Armatimonadota bacterium]
MTEDEKQTDRSQGPGDVVRNVIERIGETLDTTAKTARLSLDIGALNARRGAVFQEMGRKVYELYGRGLVKNAALLALCAEVAQLDAQIAEKRARIAQLRGQHPDHEAPDESEELGIEEDTEEGKEAHRADDAGSGEDPAQGDRRM